MKNMLQRYMELVDLMELGQLSREEIEEYSVLKERLSALRPTGYKMPRTGIALVVASDLHKGTPLFDLEYQHDQAAASHDGASPGKK